MAHLTIWETELRTMNLFIQNRRIIRQEQCIRKETVSIKSSSKTIVFIFWHPVCVCVYYVFLLYVCICEWKLMPCLSPRGSIGALLPRLQERSETGSGLATAITLHHLLWACTCMHLRVHRYTVHVYMDTFVWRRRDDRGDGRAIQNIDEKSFKALSLL